MYGSTSSYRQPLFDTIDSATFELHTAAGIVAINGSFPVVINYCNITYVTTTTDYSVLLIHVHNGYNDFRTIQTVSDLLIGSAQCYALVAGHCEWD